MRTALNYGITLFATLVLFIGCVHTAAPLTLPTDANITLLEAHQPISVYGGADIVTFSVTGHAVVMTNPSDDRVNIAQRSLTDSGCAMMANCGVYIQLRAAPTVTREQLNAAVATLLELYSPLQVSIYLRLQEDSSLQQIPLVAEVTIGQVALP